MANSDKIEKSVKAFLDLHPADQIVLTDRIGASVEKHPALSQLVKQCGYVSFSNQAFWLCNPDDWHDVARDWVGPEATASDLVMRTGFGEMFIWDGAFFWFVMPHQSARIRLTEHSDWLLRKTLTNSDYSFNSDLSILMDRARKVCGPLNYDQMYNFVPALALGGSEKKSTIDISGMREALSILFQLSPPKKFGI